MRLGWMRWSVICVLLRPLSSPCVNAVVSCMRYVRPCWLLSACQQLHAGWDSTGTLLRGAVIKYVFCVA